jgi:hypothetical protein
MHAKSLEIRTRIYCGDSHLDVAGSFHNLGSVSTDGRGETRVSVCVSYRVFTYPSARDCAPQLVWLQSHPHCRE